MPPDSPDLFHRFGGVEACRRLSTLFYTRVAKDPILRPYFPGKTFKCAIDEFSAFLVQSLDGPPEHSQSRWWLSLKESHRRFRIGPEARGAWMKNMHLALEDARIDEPLLSSFRSLFEHSSAYLVNQGTAPVAAGDPGNELAPRWDTQRALDEVVAGVRAGDPDRALAHTPGLRQRFEHDRAGLAHLLALMIEGGHGALLDYVRQTVLAHPDLVRENYAMGRTLLHAASSAGNLSLVELLLSLGADPNSGRHPPLYCVGNECGGPQGAEIVRTLVRAGAKVDANEGVKQCTALHMAARRGHVDVAGALLDCGAHLEARDSLGDTPLRRAVNCAKPAVAALLLARGANPRSIGSKGITPMLAARTAAMKQVFVSAFDRSAASKSL